VVDAPAKKVKMSGCPKCGSQRLKGTSLTLVSPIAELLFSRRHYRCSECGWRGWKHRLRRLGKPTGSLIDNGKPQARANWFFVLLIGLLLAAAVVLVRSCEPADPNPMGRAADPTSSEGLT
jgi:DNA-directed RNA polymerase subunit RPC12/RpoP